MRRIEIIGMYPSEEYERVAQLARIGASTKSRRMVSEYRDGPEDAELQEELLRDLAAVQMFEDTVKALTKGADNDGESV